MTLSIGWSYNWVIMESCYEVTMCQYRFSSSTVYRMITLTARFMDTTWANLGPTGPRWAPCWPHELCYLCMLPQGVWSMNGFSLPCRIRLPITIHWNRNFVISIKFSSKAAPKVVIWIGLGAVSDENYFAMILFCMLNPLHLSLWCYMTLQWGRRRPKTMLWTVKIQDSIQDSI